MKKEKTLRATPRKEKKVWINWYTMAGESWGYAYSTKAEADKTAGVQAVRFSGAVTKDPTAKPAKSHPKPSPKPTPSTR